MRSTVDEVDDGNAEVFHAVDHLDDVRQGEATIVGVTENPRPRVENLDRLHAGMDLQPQVVDHGHRQLFEQGLQRGRLGEQHPLDSAEAFFAFALHQVRRQGERRSAKADQRHLARQLASQQANRVGHERHHLRRWLGVKCVHLAPRANRLRDLRSRRERHANAEGIERQEDVGEEDRGIQLEPPQRLQRHFSGEVRRPAQVQKIDAAAQFAVFRQVAAGLAHDPEWRAVHRFAPAGTQETIVHRAIS